MMEHETTDDSVSPSSYKRHSKKCKRKKEVKFKEDFSKLLKKVYEQNASNVRFSIMQRRRWMCKREIPEYEEDISNRLKRIKLDDIDGDEGDCIEEIKWQPNVVFSNLIAYQKTLDCSVNSYFNKLEINEHINLKEKSEILLSKPLINFLEQCNTKTRLPYQHFAVKPDARNTHDEILRENPVKTECCLSRSEYLENEVCMSEELNVAYASEKNEGYLDELQSSNFYPKNYSNVPIFDGVNQNLKDMSSFILKETISKIIRPEGFEGDNPFFHQRFSITGENLRFTSWNVHHSYLKSDVLDTFGEKESIFSTVQDNAETDCPKREDLQKYIDIGKVIKEENQTGKKDEDLNPASGIKKTIVDLFMLEIKIKQCKEVLKKFGISSDSYESFKKLKLKSAKLIKTYKILMNRKNKEKTRMEKSRKRACARKSNVSDENISILNDSFSSTLNIQEEENSCVKENEVKSNPFHKRKRKKKTDDEMQKPGRSKILDECIMRLNSSKIYSGKNKKEPECLEEKNSSQSLNSKESKDTEDVIKSELRFTAEKTPVHKQASHDPFDQEIDKILSQLPSVENISNVLESSDQEYMNIGLKEPSDYVTENSKSFVLYPYVTTQ